MPPSPEVLAVTSLAGLGLDLFGGLYLAYDLLGGRDGPLVGLTRAASYGLFYLAVYTPFLGLRFAGVSAVGLGAILGVEFSRARLAAAGRVPFTRGALVGFAALRGLTLGAAAAASYSLGFGLLFGLLSALALAWSYAAGFAPTDEFDPGRGFAFSRQKLRGVLTRSGGIALAGVLAGCFSHSVNGALRLGLQVGAAVALVNALLALSSASVEAWAGALPERRLGVAGVALIAIGVVLQSVQYWSVLLR